MTLKLPPSFVSNLRIFSFIVILNFFIAIGISGQSLTIYAIPSPKPLNWKSPHHLLVSLSKNYMIKQKKVYSNRQIGHVFIEIIDANGDSLYTSMSTKDDESYDDVIKKKKGMAVLFKRYAGLTEPPEDIKKEITGRADDGRIAFVRFLITEAAVMHLKNFIDSFCLLGYDKIYGGMNLPRKGKGTGCSSYAVSFLEIIGLLKEEFKEHWMVKVDVPEKLISDSVNTSKVRLRRILFTFHWADKDKKSKQYLNYEPSKMFRWITYLYDHKNLAEKKGFRLVHQAKAKGLEIDSRDICRLKYPLFGDSLLD